jgi:hypothetical protein
MRQARPGQAVGTLFAVCAALMRIRLQIFETAAAFPPSAVDMIDAEFPVHNQV